MLLHTYQVFSSLVGDLHLIVHFFFNFMEYFFFGHPIYIPSLVASVSSFSTNALWPFVTNLPVIYMHKSRNLNEWSDDSDDIDKGNWQGPKGRREGGRHRSVMERGRHPWGVAELNNDNDIGREILRFLSSAIERNSVVVSLKLLRLRRMEI